MFMLFTSPLWQGHEIVTKCDCNWAAGVVGGKLTIYYVIIDCTQSTLVTDDDFGKMYHKLGIYGLYGTWVPW